MNVYKTEQIEYVDLDKWRKAVRDARLQYEAEAKKLDERLEVISRELIQIEKEEDLIAQATRMI